MGLLGWIFGSKSGRHHRASSAVEVNGVGRRTSLPRNISLYASVPGFRMPRPMQGRICALSALLLTLAIAAAPAQADQTLHLGDVATADAVVTSWTIQGAAGRPVQLRGPQDGARNPGPATLTPATSDAVTPSSDSQTFSARLPIAAGGRLALVGGTGSETVTATVV